jgi:hypothetical protein
MTDNQSILNVHELVDSIHSHHIKLNGLVVLVLVGMLALFGVFYFHSEHAYQTALAKAESRETVYLQKLDDLEMKWSDSQKQIQALSTQQAQVRTQVVYRDKQAADVQKAVLATDRGVEQVSQDVQTAYHLPKIDLIGDKFTFDVHIVQSFVATKLDRDRLAADLEDAWTDLDLEQQKTAKLTTDFNEAKGQLGEAKKTIDGYKNVAKKTRWMRVKDAAKTVAIIGGSVFLGRAIGKAGF